MQYKRNGQANKEHKKRPFHKNPELYPDLVVRVTGFTAYFITLSPEFRQLVVDRMVDIAS